MDANIFSGLQRCFPPVVAPHQQARSLRAAHPARARLRLAPGGPARRLGVALRAWLGKLASLAPARRAVRAARRTPRKRGWGARRKTGIAPPGPPPPRPCPSMVRPGPRAARPWAASGARGGSHTRSAPPPCHRPRIGHASRKRLLRPRFAGVMAAANVAAPTPPAHPTAFQAPKRGRIPAAMARAKGRSGRFAPGLPLFFCLIERKGR